MSNLLSSCAAVAQSTSGGGGVGGLEASGIGIAPESERYTFEGSTTLAVKDCVGEANVERSLDLVFFGIGGAAGLRSVSSSISLSMCHQ